MKDENSGCGVTFNPKKGDKSPRMLSQKVKLITPDQKGSMYVTFSFFPEKWYVNPDGKFTERPGLVDVNRKERKQQQINNLKNIGKLIPQTL